MLKIRRSTAAMLSGLFIVAASTTPVLAEDNAANMDRIKRFAGVWKAPEYQVAANTDLDVSVWGQGASKVRKIQLSLEPDGNGVLRVHNSVVDARGRVRPYSTSVVEARLRLEAPEKWDETRIEPVVTVVGAEERYLDGTGEKIVIEGLKVSINSMTNMQSLNIRYDTAQGTGSFGETLTRPTTRNAPKSASRKPATGGKSVSATGKVNADRS